MIFGFSSLRFLFLAVVFFAVADFYDFSLIAQNMPEVPLEDAPTEGMGQKIDKNEPSSTREDSGKNKSTLDIRLFSIGTFNYQPILDTSHLAVVNGLFEEKSASALLNFEAIAHPEQPQNASMVLKLDAEVMVSSLYQTDSPFFDKGAGDWVRLDELFWEASRGSVVSFLIGKYRHIFSPGLFQNPLDRYNPTSTMPGEPAQREGAWISELSFDGDFKLDLLSRFRLSFALLPNFFEDKSGLPVSERDRIVLNSMSPLGFSYETEKYSMDNFGAFGRFYADILKGDFNLIYYFTENQHQGGFSYSRYFFNALEWHGEILFYQNPHSDLLLANERDYYIDALTGLRLDIGDYTTFSLEYLFRQENPESYPEDALDQRQLWLGQLGTDSNGHALTPMRHYIIFSFLAVNLKDVFDIALNVVTNPVDNEYLFSLRTDLKLDKASKISLAGTCKLADADTFYGNFMPFDYQLRLEYYIALF